MDIFGLAARTYLIGLAVAAPVGAMGVLCIQRTLAGGFRVGLSTGLGIATADAAYASVAAFGLSAVSGALVDARLPLQLGGGVVLLVLGAKAAFSAPASVSTAETVVAAPERAYASALGLTLTNPMTIMAFVAVFAGAGLAGLRSPASAAVAVAGVGLGSATWWLALSATVAALRHGMSDRALLAVNRASGAVVSAMGVLAIVATALH